MKTPDQGTALRPRARLLRTIGEELISNEVVAIIELVKNAYDADATRVLIRFVGPLELGKGRIEVIDNGHGMDLSTVYAVWMELATPSKRGKIRRTEVFKRRYLGAKGIGRFASSRLAEELEVVSRVDGAGEEIYALFDWRQFDDENKYLDEILILWESRVPIDIRADGKIKALWKSAKRLPPLRKLEHGTILSMSGLKQRWEGQQFFDLKRALARLVSPTLSDEDSEHFQVELDLPEEYSQFGSRVEAPAILKHPHYVVNGTVAADGSFKFAYRVLAEGIEESYQGRFIRLKDARGRFVLRILPANDIKDGIDAELRSVECGPLEIELRVWDRDELGNVVQKTQSTIRDVRSDLDAVAGINIYRDHFRVLPYGEPKDDWLRLDIRRVQNPTLRLSNNQLFGVIHISADRNPNLHDQSNREGLDENQALNDLREAITEVLARLETLRYSTRPRESGSSGRPVGGLFAALNLKPISDLIEKKLPADKDAKDLMEQTERSFGGQLKEIQNVLARYQRLATLGQLIDHVLHEGRQPIAAINNEADLGMSETETIDNVSDAILPRLAARFGVIRSQGDILSIAFRRMEPFGGRRRGRPAQLYLEDVIAEAFAVFSDDMDRLKVRTSLPSSQNLVRVDPAEMQEVILNLLQNSLYWLEQVSETRREIAVRVDRKGQDHIDILFSDSGPGISKENRELIFEPYFSTKPEGVGLGLAIVGEIVSDYYAGSVELLEDGPLIGANFLITLRKRV